MRGTTTESHRRMDTRYPAGPCIDTTSGVTGTRYVEISTRHHSARRSLYSHVTVVSVFEVDGVVIEQFDSSTPFVRIAETAVPRYSSAALLDRHTEVVRMFQDGEFDLENTVVGVFHEWAKANS